jgi:hypothetical protein
LCSNEDIFIPEFSLEDYFSPNIIHLQIYIT